MATYTTYRGVTIRSPDPTGDGGLAWQNNFKELADRLGNHIDAADDPDANDDSAGTGGEDPVMTLSTWLNTSSSEMFVCVAPTVGNARWRHMSIDFANVAITGGTINGTTIGGTTKAAGTFTSIGVGGAIVSGYPATFYESVDGQGVVIKGAGAQSGYSIAARVNSSGHSEIVSTRSLYTQTGAGGLYTIDLGDKLYIRDVDASLVARVWFDSAANPATGRIVVPEDATNSIVLGVGGESKLGHDGVGLQITGDVGFGGTAVAGYPATFYESVNGQGILIKGQVDPSKYLQLYVVGSTLAYVLSNVAINFQSTGTMVFTAGGGGNYFRSSSVFDFQDYDASNTTRLTIDSAASPATGRVVIAEDSASIFVLGVGGTFKIGAGSSGGLLTGKVSITANARFNDSETTSTPSGTTQTVDLTGPNHQTLNCSSASGDLTVTFTPPNGPSGGTLIVAQGATARDITWAVTGKTIKWLGTEPTWNADTNKYRIVSWRYDGTFMMLAATDTD